MKLTNEWSHPLGLVTFKPGPSNKAVVDDCSRADLPGRWFPLTIVLPPQTQKAIS